MSSNITTTSKIKIIVAVSDNNIIGNKGEIPWKLPAEMKHFKKTTSGHTVVMGRKTWESLLPFCSRGHLEGRYNIVLSNDKNKIDELSKAYGPGHPYLSFYGPDFDIKHQAEINKDFNGDLTNELRDPHIFIIGGAEIYKKYLDEDVVDEVILTRVKMRVPGDATFPELPNDKWLLLSVEETKYFDIMHYQRSR